MCFGVALTKFRDFFFNFLIWCKTFWLKKKNDKKLKMSASMINLAESNYIHIKNLAPWTTTSPKLLLKKLCIFVKISIFNPRIENKKKTSSMSVYEKARFCENNRKISFYKFRFVHKTSEVRCKNLGSSNPVR